MARLATATPGEVGSLHGLRGTGRALRLEQLRGSAAFSHALHRHEPDFSDRDGSTAIRNSAVFSPNLWRGRSVAYTFRHLDDLEPVAPMDRLAPSSAVDEIQDLPSPAHNAQYVPPYLIPDAFPTVTGASCLCEDARPAPPTPEQLAWARIVADQIGIPVGDLSQQLSEGQNKCSCENSSQADAYHWVKIEPGASEGTYKISPADLTYSAGDYWDPRVAGGLVAPGDRMPASSYPVQSRSDTIAPLPSTAREDRIATRFARYIDQVEARSSACDGVRPECITPCAPSDQVVFHLGNTALNATVVSLHSAGRVRVQFAPSLAEGAAGGMALCPVASGCTPFRLCKGPESCVEPRGEVVRGFKGMLHHRLRCPSGTVMCRLVQQDVDASRLSKGDKACAAA